MNMRVETSSPALSGLKSALDGVQNSTENLDIEISGMLGGAARRMGLPPAPLENVAAPEAQNPQSTLPSELQGKLQFVSVGLVVPNGTNGTPSPALREGAPATTGTPANPGASGAPSPSDDDGTVKDESGKPIPMFTAGGFYNPEYAKAKLASMKYVPSSADGDAGDDEDVAFGQAARTVDAWISTSSATKGKGISVSDLQDIANGTGVGAGASDDVKAAAKTMLADGGEKFKQEIAGRDGTAHQNNLTDYVVADQDTPLSDDEIQTLSVLARHLDAVNGSTGDLINKINDPKTPPDLKAALQQFASDPILQKLDAGKTGKRDGKFGAEDVTALISQHPEVQQYMEQQADTFTYNYVPSDVSAGDQ